jgi:hypothetical protein
MAVDKWRKVMKTIRRDGSIEFADSKVEWIYQASMGLVAPNDREILELTQARFQPNGTVILFSEGDLSRVSYSNYSPCWPLPSLSSLG